MEQSSQEASSHLASHEISASYGTRGSLLCSQGPTTVTVISLNNYYNQLLSPFYK